MVFLHRVSAHQKYWRLLRSLEGVVEQFPKAGSPSEKFAIQYALAHLPGFELAKASSGFLEHKLD